MDNNIGKARSLYGKKLGRKITQDEAAQMFKIASSTYKRWEQGVGKLNGEILCMIADKYGVSVDYLICRTNDPTPYPPVGTLPRVNRDEQQLIKAFRDCTPREKDALLNTAEAMADNGKAKNMEDSGAEEAIGA